MISLSEFARRAGCDRKQVRRAVEKGLLSKGDSDLLLAADVEGAWRQPNIRTIMKEGGTTAAGRGGTNQLSHGGGTTGGRTRKTVPPPDETPAEAAERIIANHPLLTTLQARELKENYLARREQFEYDRAIGTVVLIADVSKAVGSQYATVRKKLLAIPAEHAPAIQRCQTVVEVQDLLLIIISAALKALTLDEPPSG